MKIGYRRWSRPVGLSPDEKFKISGWYEKRLAFLEMLEDRGHECQMLSGLTKESAQAFGQSIFRFPVEELDLLFIEVSNKNVFQNYKVIAESVEILNRATCPVILLWDDPELKMDIHTSIRSPLPRLEMKSRDYEVWVNAEYIPGNEDKLERTLFPVCGRVPHGKTHFKFFPFGALLKYEASPSVYKYDDLVYVGGHSGGRLKQLEFINKWVILSIYYSSKSYPIPINGEPPRQPERKAFYGQYLANLGLQDSLHKKLGWHTGRCFHALAGGIPSIVEQDSVLAKYFTGGNLENIIKGKQFIHENRASEYHKSICKVRALSDVISINLKSHGL